MARARRFVEVFVVAAKSELPKSFIGKVEAASAELGRFCLVVGLEQDHARLVHMKGSIVYQLQRIYEQLIICVPMRGQYHELRLLIW